MFVRFESTYGRGEGQRRPSPEIASDSHNHAELATFFRAYAGLSFGGSMYRVVASDTFASATYFARTAFPQECERWTPFGYDWLGRVFALDRGRLEEGKPGVVMLEPGTGQFLEIPRDLTSFHEAELIEYPDAALASEFFERWVGAGGARPLRDQCVGYRVPLFFGGQDEVENLALADLDVFLTLAGQLIAKVRGV